MSFDSFLNTVKRYAQIFLAGFAGGLASYLFLGLAENNFDNDFYENWDFYAEGIVGGTLYLLIGIVDSLLYKISFMKSLYDKMTPVYYSIVAPFLLAMFLFVAIPLRSLPRVVKLIQNEGVKLMLQGLFEVFQDKLKDLMLFMMVRMLFDSLAQMIQNQQFRTLDKSVRALSFVLMSCASAFASIFVSYLIESKLIAKVDLFSTDRAVKKGLHEVFVTLPYTLVSYLISNDEKYIPFSDSLMNIELTIGSLATGGIRGFFNKFRN